MVSSKLCFVFKNNQAKRNAMIGFGQQNANELNKFELKLGFRC